MMDQAYEASIASVDGSEVACLPTKKTASAILVPKSQEHVEAQSASELIVSKDDTELLLVLPRLLPLPSVILPCRSAWDDSMKSMLQAVSWREQLVTSTQSSARKTHG